MPRIAPAAVLILNAVLAAISGAVLLLAPTSGFFENLGLPPADPGIYAQIAGGLFLVFAVLLWEAPVDPVLERHVGRAAAIANALAALIVVLWLLSGELDISDSGRALLWVSVALLALLAAAESSYLRPPPRRGL